MGIVAVRVPDECKRRMAQADLNWSEYLREAIVVKLDQLERRKILRKLERMNLPTRRLPAGTGAASVREDRDAR